MVQCTRRLGILMGEDESTVLVPVHVYLPALGLVFKIVCVNDLNENASEGIPAD